MRYSVPLKFVAILLTALALTVSLVCVLGIVQAEDFDLFTHDFDDWVHQRLEWQAYDLASGLAERYAVLNLSNCSAKTMQQLGYRHILEDVFSWSGFSEHSFSYTVTSMEGEVVDSAMHGPGEGVSFALVCSAQYPVLVKNEAVVDRVYGRDYVRMESVELEGYENTMTVRYYESPRYTVTVNLLQEVALSRYGSSVPLVKALYELRFTMMWVLALALTVLAGGMVLLCCMAGKLYPGTAPRPGGLNRLPLDLHLLAGGGVGTLLCTEVVRLVGLWLRSGEDFNFGTLVIVALLLLGTATVLVGFLYAMVAQLKMKNAYWWHKTLLRRLVQGAGAVLDRMPVIWKYLLLGLGMGGAVVLSTLMAAGGSWVALGLVLLGCIGIVCYGACAFASLLRGARRMAGGNLEEKIDTRFLFGSYARCAEALNDLADVAEEAARKQMHSERMKTELITNVSHDIKTPLTSIINYVDLLQRASHQADSVQYLEVLGRQSQRLKKLIEDLMELSRASTGSMPVEIVTLDAGETVRQALGEFSEKLENAGLTVVCTQQSQSLRFLGDGRMTWRVLSNLLSNAVKYAMPGTRIYFEVAEKEHTVLLSLKNISREPLNVSAEELTERFVRGEASRNTEGSGLGLNIAKSLMELQKGSLRLTVDGDLFKVTLEFPKDISRSDTA